jgi:nucleoside-diphosphate-sugar epimerase
MKSLWAKIKFYPQPRFTKGMLLRILADIIMVNVALLVALIMRFFVVFWFQRSGSMTLDLNNIFRHSFIAYGNYSWLLTILCLAVFYFSGFYTYGRAYRSRYKILVIFQAVTLAYLIFGILSYGLRIMKPLPKSSFVMGWIFTSLLLAGARIWSTLWRAIVKTEAELLFVDKVKKMHNILVIGGAGYIGSTLVRRLVQKDYHVRILDLLLYGDESIQELYANQNFELVKGDFRHIDTVVNCMKDIDVVVHLGAIVGDPACTIDKNASVEINLIATRMIAEVAKGFGVKRFIFASSCSVYGASDQTLNEQSALNPVSIYAKTKIDSEKVLLAMNGPKFSPTILRLASVYGLSPRPRFDLVVNLITARAVTDREITIFGGEQWRPFIHVEDVVSAIDKIIEAPVEAIKGEIFNVGSDDQNYKIHQIGNVVKRLVPQAKIIYKKEETDRRNYYVSFGKIKKSLDFISQRNVKNGILEIKDALQNGKIVNYRDAKYNNYSFLNSNAKAKIRQTDFCLYPEYLGE